MNRLSLLYPAHKPCRMAALLVLLFAAFPGTAFAQKTAPAPPPAAAPFPDLVTPPAPSQKVMLAQDSRLDRAVTLDVISVPLGEVLQKENLDKSTNTMEDAHKFLLTAAPCGL